MLIVVLEIVAIAVDVLLPFLQDGFELLWVRGFVRPRPGVVIDVLEGEKRVQLITMEEVLDVFHGGFGALADEDAMMRLDDVFADPFEDFMVSLGRRVMLDAPRRADRTGFAVFEGILIDVRDDVATETIDAFIHPEGDDLLHFF